MSEKIKQLDDIPVTPVELFFRLVEMAEAEVAKNTPAASPQPSSSRRRRSARQYDGDLGRFSVGLYLDHYGIRYQVKQESTKTIYQLRECLFNPDHGNREAAIIQDNSGTITYHCYHESCNYRWSDARSYISGDDKLARFCEGYDPNWSGKEKKQPEERKSKWDTGKASPDPSPAGDSEPEPDGEQPEPPEEVSAWDFFEDNGKKYRPQFLAKYLQAWLDPIKYDGSDFYRYLAEQGVWKKTSENFLGQISEVALDKYAGSGRIADAITLLSHRSYVLPEDFLHDPAYLNLRSGMLEVESLSIVEHDPKYNSRIQLPVNYDLGAACPRWEKFLTEIFPGKDGREKAITLQTFFGYCLIPDCRFQKCLFLIGNGANGKSVVVDVLVALLGQENVSSLPLQLFGQRFLIGQLKDKLVNVAGEAESNSPIDTANFKDAVSGGLLMADEKHGKPFGFYPIAKHIFSMNEIPKISDKSHGFKRRPIILKFTEQFEGAKKDPSLLGKLLDELDGIFVWMLDGLNMVLQSGQLFIPDVVREESAEFVRSTNPVLLFVEEECTLKEGAMIAPKKLYEAYDAWCTEAKNRPLSRNKFYTQIQLHFPVKKKQVGNHRKRMMVGIELNPIGAM